MNLVSVEHPVRPEIIKRLKLRVLGGVNLKTLNNILIIWLRVYFIEMKIMIQLIIAYIHDNCKSHHIDLKINLNI